MEFIGLSRGIYVKRYINKQPHLTTCGPIAIINCLKYLGEPATYQDWPHIYEWVYEHGLKNDAMSRILKTFGIKYKRIKKPTLKEIVNSCKEFTLILNYRHQDTENGHYVFVHGQSRRIFFAENSYDRGHSKKVIEREYILKNVWIIYGKH